MTDESTKAHVVAELEWEPSVHAEHIGVTVRDGVVTLSGHVASYFEKFAANRAVMRVSGAKAIAEELTIRFPDSKTDGVSDEDIAHRALSLLSWNVAVPDTVKVKVEKGLVNLSGTVDWFYQRAAAEADMRKLQGVTGVLNSIGVKPACIHSDDVAGKIKAALERNADLEAAKIDVTASGSTITLAGKVANATSRSVAEKTAWSAPGVMQVEDLLTIA